MYLATSNDVKSALIAFFEQNGFSAEVAQPHTLAGWLTLGSGMISG